MIHKNLANFILFNHCFRRLATLRLLAYIVFVQMPFFMFQTFKKKKILVHKLEQLLYSINFMLCYNLKRNLLS